MRNHRLLDSNEGIVRFDLDMLVHRYKFVDDYFGGRDVQAMMFIEIKQFGADLNDSQRDTLAAMSQIFRNRRDNRHRKKRGKHADDRNPPAKTYSQMRQREVHLKLLGGHLLQLQNDTPDDSAWMKWDKKWTITKDQLISILRFDVDPDNIEQPCDWRRRSYRNLPGMTLF